jgi:hypothetical protein
VDSSNENGELETNDTDYAYDYLMMPRTVKELAAVSMKALKLIGTEYELDYQEVKRTSWMDYRYSI